MPHHPVNNMCKAKRVQFLPKSYILSPLDRLQRHKESIKPRRPLSWVAHASSAANPFHGACLHQNWQILERSLTGLEEQLFVSVG